MEDQATNILDANGLRVGLGYDELGRLIERSTLEEASGLSLDIITTERFSWGVRGMVHQVDELGQTNYYGYDELGRKMAETNANNEAVQFTYSPGNDLLTLTDGKNQVT